MKLFKADELKNLYKPKSISSKEENGQVTVIGGSKLFHGAPILSLKIASRIVDMVFFASPDPSVGKVAEYFRSKLMSFIWVPWEDVESYIEKSDAVLIGPGFMRFGSETIPNDERLIDCDESCKKTLEITKYFLEKFPDKKWVVDAGSLQVITADILPKGCIITPNRKEFEILFKEKLEGSVVKNFNQVNKMAKELHCTIVLKGPETIVCSPDNGILIEGGNPGLTKGGTGDVQAGLTVALFTKNEPFLTASSASYLVKAAADSLYGEVGVYYSADDLADRIPEVLFSMTK